GGADVRAPRACCGGEARVEPAVDCCGAAEPGLAWRFRRGAPFNGRQLVPARSGHGNPDGRGTRRHRPTREDRTGSGSGWEARAARRPTVVGCARARSTTRLRIAGGAPRPGTGTGTATAIGVGCRTGARPDGGPCPLVSVHVSTCANARRTTRTCPLYRSRCRVRPSRWRDGRGGHGCG